jgi:hypothetical protein
VRNLKQRQAVPTPTLEIPRAARNDMLTLYRIPKSFVYNLLYLTQGSGTSSLLLDVGIRNTFLVSKNVGITGRIYYSVEPFDNPIVHILGIQFGVSTFIF